MTASCPRCPGGLAPPPPPGFGGGRTGPGQRRRRGGGGRVRYAAPPRSGRGLELAPPTFAELGCLGEGERSGPPRFSAEWRRHGRSESGAAGALPAHLGVCAGEGAKRRGREAESREMNESGLPVVDLGQEVRRSVLHMTGFRFSKWQRELIVFPSCERAQAAKGCSSGIRPAAGGGQAGREGGRERVRGRGQVLLLRR